VEQGVALSGHRANGGESAASFAMGNGLGGDEAGAVVGDLAGAAGP
jgi:hypothetical protein